MPFQPDFRLFSGNGTEVSAATAARWRQVVADITNPNKRKRDDYELDDGLYERMQYTQTPVKKIARGALSIAEAMLIAEVPPAAIPIMGLEMVMDPKYYSHVAGGSAIATTAGLAYLGAKNLI